VSACSSEAFIRNAADPHVNSDFIDRTLEFWRARSSQPRTPEDARQAIENIAGFFGILLEWEASEGGAATEIARGRSRKLIPAPRPSKRRRAPLVRKGQGLDPQTPGGKQRRLERAPGLSCAGSENGHDCPGLDG
jgi:hypothetical protein